MKMAERKKKRERERDGDRKGECVRYKKRVEEKPHFLTILFSLFNGQNQKAAQARRMSNVLDFQKECFRPLDFFTLQPYSKID